MKKTALSILTIALFLTVLCLTGCSRYTSSYQAVGFVHSLEYDSAYMSFFEFEGTMVFKLHCDQGAEKAVKYTAELEKGNITVYYADDGSKTELFSVGSGDDINSSKPLPQHGTVHIIVETDGKCENGDLHFSIE